MHGIRFSFEIGNGIQHLLILGGGDVTSHLAGMRTCVDDPASHEMLGILEKIPGNGDTVSVMALVCARALGCLLLAAQAHQTDSAISPSHAIEQPPISPTRRTISLSSGVDNCKLAGTYTP